MKVRVVLSLFTFLFIFGAGVYAQDVPKVDIFAGYSYVRENPATTGARSFNLNGGSASIAYNANHWLSGVADFGGYTNGNILKTNVSGTLSTYLFGPRVSYRHFDRVTPFAQVLFGVAHANTNFLGASGSDNAFGMTVGGGVDYNLSRNLAVSPLQVVYLLTRISYTGNSALSQHTLRASAGFDFSFLRTLESVARRRAEGPHDIYSGQMRPFAPLKKYYWFTP